MNTPAELQRFCRTIRARSVDNKKATYILSRQRNITNLVSILRQELDSLIRVMYLLSIKDLKYRNKLIGLSLKGEKWRKPNGKTLVTDKDMVELANSLTGWAEYVYKFGCAFIHLSGFHDYRETDPLTMLSQNEKEDIVRYLRHYHGGPPNDEPSFEEIIFFLPMVFEKINDNLQRYLTDLESGRIIDND